MCRRPQRNQHEILSKTKRYKMVLSWFLIRIESKNGWGGGFSDKKDGMKWLISEDHVLSVD